MSSTYEDQGPIPWYRTEHSLFYIVFFVVYPFFFVNIFVALIIVTFNELGEAELEDDMDKNQKSCIDFAIQVEMLFNWFLIVLFFLKISFFQAKPLELYVPTETTGVRWPGILFWISFFKWQQPARAGLHGSHGFVSDGRKFWPFHVLIFFNGSLRWLNLLNFANTKALFFKIMIMKCHFHPTKTHPYVLTAKGPIKGVSVWFQSSSYFASQPIERMCP